MAMLAGVGSALGSGLSLFGGLEGMFGGGGANQVSLPQQVSTQGQQGALNQGIPQLGGYNLGGTNLGQYQNILQNTLNNPFAGGMIGGNAAFGGQAMGNAAMLGGTVPGQIGAAGQIMNTAFDPQNALFNQQSNLVQQQQLAGLEGAGIAQTPWGQGVLGNTMQNFDINWQNQQLGRQLQGLSGAEGAIGGAGQTAQGALGLGLQGAGAPYGAFNQIGAGNLGLLQGGAGYGQSSAAIPQQQLGDWQSYLAAMNQANQGAGQLGLAQNQMNFLQQQAYGQQIGQGLGGFAQLARQNTWPSFGGGGGGYNPMGGALSPAGGNLMSPSGFSVGGA